MPVAGLVRNALMAVLAMAVKRGWSERPQETRGALLFVSRGGKHARCTAICMGGTAAGMERTCTHRYTRRACPDIVPLQEVMSLVGACGAPLGGAEVACAGLQVLEALLSEFNLPTATPLGLAWDYHERCAREIEVKS
jgi:hypothetical protein